MITGADGSSRVAGQAPAVGGVLHHPPSLPGHGASGPASVVASARGAMEAAGHSGDPPLQAASQSSHVAGKGALVGATAAPLSATSPMARGALAVRALVVVAHLPALP